MKICDCGSINAENTLVIAKKCNMQSGVISQYVHAHQGRVQIWPLFAPQSHFSLLNCLNFWLCGCWWFTATCLHLHYSFYDDWRAPCSYVVHGYRLQCRWQIWVSSEASSLYLIVAMVGCKPPTSLVSLSSYFRKCPMSTSTLDTCTLL